MRILYLTDRLSLRGGADLHLLDVIAAISRRHDVLVAYGSRQHGATVVAPAVELRLRSLSSAVPEIAQRERFDQLIAGAEVIHLHNVMNPPLIAAAVASGKAVATVQDHRIFCPGPGKRLPDGAACREPMDAERCRACSTDAQYARRMLSLTEDRLKALDGAALIVLSQYMAQELSRVGLAGAEVIPPWIAPSAEPAVAGRGVIVGGRLVAQKGALDASEAFGRSGVGARHPLSVAGAGSLAAALGGELLGWLPRDALRRQLRAARVMLFPSAWQEPFGVLGVEALAEGTPVIVASSGGTDAWHDAGCVCVPPGDIEAMAAAIRALCADDERAEALGRQGQAMVAERFAEAPLLARLEERYRRVAGQAFAKRINSKAFEV